MKIKCYKYLLILPLFFNMIISSSTNINGQAEYFYMLRLENAKLVNIPFRLLDLDVQHQVSDSFNVFGNIGIEYRNREDTDFMTDSNLEDFLLDIRELYMSYYFNNNEIRIGKQIHGWGSVDENSPIDNLNAYDYYYLLLGGSEKKLGAYSFAYDIESDYFYELLGATQKISFVYSPMHNTSRIPVNDPDYPIGLPEGSSPSKENTILNDNTLGEYGVNIKSSFNFGDISLSHLSMYDRIFNVTGINLYNSGHNNPDFGMVDFFDNNAGINELQIFYSYRLTEVNNIGAVFLFDDFTLSFDYGDFKSEDQNTLNDLAILHPTNPDLFTLETGEPDFFQFEEDIEDPDTGQITTVFTGEVASIPFEEKARYSQLAVQFEMPLENDFTVNAQYFKHDLYEYSYSPLPLDDDIEITNASIDVDEFSLEDIFIPGVGTPYAIITSEAMLINIEKVFPDNNLTIDISTFLDADRGEGKLVSIEAEYELESGVELGIGITKIYGDDAVDNYNFNNMESFSSFRSRLTYYF